ncbi:MAG: nucleoside deaminase [Prolixibacteraceae bacterium]
MNEIYMQKAIGLAKKGMESGAGGPFGAVVVKGGKIIGEGYNNVILTNDPTAHAEITAIRNACKTLDSYQLEGCTLYTSCEPCPMCLGAIYWARPEKVFYACTRKDAANAGFDDHFIYGELEKINEHRKIKFQNILRKKALPLFTGWLEKPDKKQY